MGSWIGIPLIEVGRASACGGLEAEGQKYYALCLRSFVPQDKLSDPQACPVEWRQVYSTERALLNQKYRLSAFDTHYSNNPTFHHSMWKAQIYRGKQPMISIYCRNSERFNSRSEFVCWPSIPVLRHPRGKR
jgi:hypothetical protein